MERNDERVRTVRKEAGDNSNNNSYLDRSKVRILLCDNDAKSSKEVFNLLCKCSYQGCTIYAAGVAWNTLRIECSMPLHIYIRHCIDSINYSCDVFALTVFTHCLAVTSVRTPRQVIDALNAEGPDIDIILAEVDLPVAKGLKLLKYIMRDAELQRIPIIMMSAQDEVSVVVKCLKHGAADYLVKPLRTNELLNLWTHMWRRRHMLGLSEKKIMNYDFDLVASDPSDANTNSTTLFSDDTDEKSRRSSILENSISNYREDEPNDAAFIEPALNSSSEHHPCVLRPSDQTVQFSSFSKRSELKIGESSAFFTYVKSSITPRIYQRMGSIDENDSHVEQWTKEQETVTWSKPGNTDAQRYTATEALENCHIGNAFLGSDTSHDTSYAERSCLPVPSEFHQARNSKEEQPARVPTHPRNEAQFSVPGLSTLPSLPYYVPGMMNQVMMPSSSQLFQANQHDVQKHAASTILPQYNSRPKCSNHVPMMTSFPYYPIQVCMQTGQMPASQLWPANGISCSAEVKTDRIGRREAALIKFRQKRKDRCFDKKIRYMNRKRLAERRPRVRGQFVKQMNGVDVDLNGQPINGGDSDVDVDNEEEEEEELVSR